MAWSAVVAVAAHRRVRNPILASAGAAGVATGSFLILGLLVAGPDPLLGVALLFGLLIGMGVAFATWLVMKLTGKLPPRESQ